MDAAKTPITTETENKRHNEKRKKERKHGALPIVHTCPAQ